MLCRLCDKAWREGCIRLFHNESDHRGFLNAFSLEVPTKRLLAILAPSQELLEIFCLFFFCHDILSISTTSCYTFLFVLRCGPIQFCFDLSRRHGIPWCHESMVCEGLLPMPHALASSRERIHTLIHMNVSKYTSERKAKRCFLKQIGQEAAILAYNQTILMMEPISSLESPPSSSRFIKQDRHTKKDNSSAYSSSLAKEGADEMDETLPLSSSSSSWGLPASNEWSAVGGSELDSIVLSK